MFQSLAFWIVLLVIALIAAGAVAVYHFRQRKKEKQPAQQVPQPEAENKWQYHFPTVDLAGLLKKLGQKSNDSQPGPATSPIKAPVKPGDIQSWLTLLDAEVTKVKQALHGNIEASQLELGLLSHLTDDVEVIKKVLTQSGLLAESPAKKKEESDRDRMIREWREELEAQIEQIDWWKEPQALPVDNPVVIAAPEPGNGMGLKDTLKELRRLNPSITKEEAIRALFKQGFDFKGKNPALAVQLPWANLVREESHVTK